MIGYKSSYNQFCLGHKYEPGKTYALKGILKMCWNGFHFCKNPDDVFNYYYPTNKDIVIFEVESIGKIITKVNKSVTDKIKIIRIIPFSEWNDLFTRYKFDDNKNLIYSKDCYSYEEWYEYDENNNMIHYKNSDGYEEWYQYDENNNKIHYKDSNGYEYWQEYDENDNLINFKDSDSHEESYPNF